MDPWRLQPARDMDLSPGQRARSPRRESGLFASTSHLAWSLLVRAYMRLGHRLRIRGRSHLPARFPFILAANHTSHLDTLALTAALPLALTSRVFPIAAGDVFFDTAPAALLSAVVLNALPIWRHNCGPHALDQLRRCLLDEPCGYILFPEGTRSRDGRMAAFKPGIGMLAAGLPVPVVPCYLHGCFAAFPAHARLPQLRPVRMHVGPPLRFDDVPDTRAGWLRVAAGVEAAVRALADDGAGTDAHSTQAGPLP